MVKYFHAWLMAFLGVLYSTSVLGFSQGYCKDDVTKYCSDIKPGGGRLTACMIEHEPDLAAACRAEMYAVREQLKTFTTACQQDAKQFCPRTKSGHGRVFTCLKLNETLVSESCRSQLSPVDQATIDQKNP